MGRSAQAPVTHPSHGCSVLFLICYGGHHIVTRSPRPRHNCILNFSYDTSHAKRAFMFLCRRGQSRRKNRRAFPSPSIGIIINLHVSPSTSSTSLFRAEARSTLTLR